MRNVFFTLVLSFIFTNTASAHGVHSAGEAKPQKGGVIKSLETINVEMVNIGKEIRVYIYDKKQKPVRVKSYPVSAKVVLPRGKGETTLKLKDMGKFWRATYDAKGIHRFDFIFSIEQGGHKDKLKFTIEPKK